MLLALAAASPAWGQQNAMSDAQRSDYRTLLRGYVDTFRLLGRARACGLDFDAGPYYREVVRRHGERSEPARFAGLSYAAAAENVVVGREVDPAPPAPMPCDVVALMRGGVRLPELPASLVQRD